MLVPALVPKPASALQKEPAQLLRLLARRTAVCLANALVLAFAVALGTLALERLHSGLLGPSLPTGGFLSELLCLLDPPRVVVERAICSAAFALVAHVCNALTALHPDVMHGYVTPDTTYVSKSGRVFLSGVGILRPLISYLL